MPVAGPPRAALRRHAPQVATVPSAGIPATLGKMAGAASPALTARRVVSAQGVAPNPKRALPASMLQRSPQPALHAQVCVSHTSFCSSLCPCPTLQIKCHKLTQPPTILPPINPPSLHRVNTAVPVLESVALWDPGLLLPTLLSREVHVEAPAAP